MDVTLTMYHLPKVPADQVHPFIKAVFPEGGGLCQWGNAPYLTAKVGHDRFEEGGG